MGMPFSICASQAESISYASNKNWRKEYECCHNGLNESKCK